MAKCLSVSGFCPTQNCDYEITVKYSSVHPIGENEYYRQTGADCYYGSFGLCENQHQCPLLASAPITIQ